jgi:histidyl-tRNA synthetase
MLVGEVGGIAEQQLDVAIAAENVDREVEASALSAFFRRAGFATELFATGSARKRYDRAKKTQPAILISLDVREGVRTHSLNLLNHGFERAAEAQQVFDSFGLLPK